MEQKLSRYQNLTVLLITILLHAGILLALVIIKFDQPLSEAIILLEDHDVLKIKQPPQQDWVSLSPSIAVPVTPAPQSIQTPGQNSPASSPNQETQEIDNQENHEVGNQESSSKRDEEQMHHAVALAQKLLTHLEEQAQKKGNSPLEKTPTQELRRTSKPAAPTLAQITQGFMQHVQSPMAVRSNKQGEASMEQLQQMHYLQKILACIVNSYKIHLDTALCKHTMQQARIQLALSRNGSIHTLQLAQSSGNATIDQFLIFLFQDAGLSFPPLPASFKEQIFYLPTFNVDRLEAFQSVNGWYIDNTIP